MLPYGHGQMITLCRHPTEMDLITNQTICDFGAKTFRDYILKKIKSYYPPPSALRLKAVQCGAVA